MADHAPVAYLDSSALIKLVVPEAETGALRAALPAWGRYTASALARTEVVRAAARVDTAAREPALRIVASLSLLAVTDEILARASELAPATLRTLDAIHLATALALGETLGAVVTYDARLAEAARAQSLAVAAPG